VQVVMRLSEVTKNTSNFYINSGNPQDFLGYCELKDSELYGEKIPMWSEKKVNTIFEDRRPVVFTEWRLQKNRFRGKSD
jgi:hypothetical protein